MLDCKTIQGLLDEFDKQTKAEMKRVFGSDEDDYKDDMVEKIASHLLIEKIEQEG